MDATTAADLESLLYTALVAAREAGKAILDVYESDFSISLKDDQSPLTVADEKAHGVITEHLLTAQRPPHRGHGIPVLSEEGRGVAYEERKGWGCFWLVDPLDGTKEFIKRSGEFTVNIALVVRNRPVLGVVYAPVKNLLYFAAKGIGARKAAGMSAFDLDNGVDGVVLNHILGCSVRAVCSARSGGPLRVVGSRSHGAKELDLFVRDMQDAYGDVSLVSAGSSLKFCLVAEGSADLYPRFGPTMEWDTAAGQIIVEEAGGKVVDLEKLAPLTYNTESLANPWFAVVGSSEDASIVNNVGEIVRRCRKSL